MGIAAETYRAREVYRYYQPRNLKQESGKADSPPISSRSTNTNHVYPDATNFDTQQSFSDTALTAFTQLIALRLVAQRAIVSLIDHENEYFLAESTSTLSHIDGDGHAQNAWLSISGARVPRAASLCEQTLCLVPNQHTTAEMTPVYLVPDLLLDDKMSKLQCVQGAPHLRFYCGVALTNKKGINIGCVYVVDDRPRTDFSLDQAQFLTRMAATVMDHLENIRAKEDIVRMTRMSQALHAFIEGEGTMDGDWQRLRKYNLPANAGVDFSWQSNRKDIPKSAFRGKHEHGLHLLPKTEPPTGSLKVPSNTVQSPLQHTGTNTDARFNFNNSPWSSSSDVPQLPALHSVFDENEDHGKKLSGGRDAEFVNDGFSNLLHSTFSRASNLVKEGMEVDGAVFFDAPFKFYQGRSTLETDTRRSDDKSSEGSSDSEDEVRVSKIRPGPTPHVLHSAVTKHVVTAHQSPGNAKAEVLGFSTHGVSSWDNHASATTSNFTAIDQSLLTLLVRRYPQGELFVFDDNGPISPPTDESHTLDPSSSPSMGKFERHRSRKRAEILRLLVAFPRARQIFFVPLYDSTSGCFIGSFTWSTSITRIFSAENHLSYLIAFGHSVMSEVSRLNTLSADRAKGDFISNVSHELRSPLHGILASVEFLADTALDGFQRNLVDTVDICGRTLLDTIEHVLDFSKIKKFGQESSQPMGAVIDTDVSAVIEEVIEGVYAGFEFNGLSSQGLADTTQSRNKDMPKPSRTSNATDDTKAGASKGHVTVILDMDYRDQWRFPTVPGTWRRLTMNMFGNSLKYTQDGYIKIKLEARSIPTGDGSDKGERTLVTMTITDSGRGMSSDFMKTKLFIPFSQEDVTAPGTGLGMSMVKQIVDLSGGTIDIRSEIDKGTEIKLSLPLRNNLEKLDVLADTLDPLYSEDPISAVRRRCGGRLVTVLGFGGDKEQSASQQIAAVELEAAVRKYITEWFELTIVPSDEEVDVVIADESAFLNTTNTSRTRPHLLLILCSNGTRRNRYASQSDLAHHVEFVSKPCGPHRLAKALLNCLDKEDAFQRADIDRVSQGDPQDATIPSRPHVADTRAAAGARSNMMLIGNLQSSIGFSPAIANIVPAMKSQTSLDNLSRPTSVRTLTNTIEEPVIELLSESFRSLEMLPNAISPQLKDIADSIVAILPDLEAAPEFPALRMLLVEDNPINMMLLATYMKKNKWDYETAANGLIALQAFQNRPSGFDIIFMDVSMPIMTGYESARAIRIVEGERRVQEKERWLEQHPIDVDGEETPCAAPTARPALIIALTGFSSQKDQETAFESGVDIFMTKPVRFREVGRILNGWMKSREEEILQGKLELAQVSQTAPGMAKESLKT